MAGQHARALGPMRASPRCGAKTRSGTPCQAPAVAGRARCRMHGGAKGSGAPLGNSNALKTGLHTREAKEMRAMLRELRRQTKAILEQI
ncbi:MAG: hypothetical protein K0B00_08245 [Rhodobacteraceae bacterium]|nr:hypothetical protein [Paracoccaceae bacterium]